MGRVRSGRVTVFLCVCGHGGRGARLATVSLARWTSLSHRPMHARPAWRLSVCARSVHGHVASAEMVLALCGRVSRLLVGLFGVRSLSSQRVFAQSDLLCAGVPLVAMLVGARCVGPDPFRTHPQTLSPFRADISVQLFFQKGIFTWSWLHNATDPLPGCPTLFQGLFQLPLLCTPLRNRTL